MIKRYCDCCGEKITDKNRFYAETGLIAEVVPKDRGSLPVLVVKVVPVKNGYLNDVDFCLYCVIDAVKKLDDRPKELPA